ncbi:META domain-containing protein [Acinetobacter larvae]|uniref:META domain-containing protein n=1 Tax=Acinetobacter larvae TaxID=1789224 RepID=A0A1B2LY41_9GAMM|nr:META domain-containing protein [Acinetobacter larvae]AOA57799.1 META domain-containing protein [Acinetobacter larvae]
MLKKIALTTGFIASLSMVGCATMDNPATNKNLNLLQNKDWVVTQINQVDYAPENTQTLASLKFGDSALSGSDGCNRIMGGYAVQGNKIKFSSLATTQMMCMDTVDLPEKFNTALNQVKSFAVNKSQLKLLDKEGKVVLKFRTQTNE